MAKKPETVPSLPATALDGADDQTKTGPADAGQSGVSAEAVDGALPIVDAGLTANFEPAPRAEQTVPEQTVIVKGPEKGRWRAGRHFTIEPTSIPLEELSKAEIEALCADPFLTVGIVSAPY